MSEIGPKNKTYSYKLFDQIAETYDFLNILLSLGIDRLWRKKIIRLLNKTKVDNALDMATGTGDMAILLAQSDHIKKVEGIDLSQEMISIGNEKIKKQSLSDKCELKIGDGVSIPFEDQSQDLITVTFGIRNFPDFQESMKNMHRVLRPGGKAIIMEFSLPENYLIRKFYLFYFRHVLPFIGNLISGHKNAYTYLNQTVEDFPYGQEFADHFLENGFKKVNMHPLTFGIACIYVATK
jgi:demethylmenaquinone methyltransferase / 2-methoxy-6-polyprenyl-1,4-benzoquinol methylase